MVAAERRRPVSVERATLKKDIELWSLFSLSFGTIVGVGWITVMGSWLGAAGSIGSILAFAGGGAVILLIGLCYAEIAGMYPVSGGEVAYVYETYGTRLSFATGWLLAYSYISTTSFEAVSIGWLLSAIMPGFGGPVVYSVLGADVRLWDLVLGLSLMGMITIINYRGGKTTTRFPGHHDGDAAGRHRGLRERGADRRRLRESGAHVRRSHLGRSGVRNPDRHGRDPLLFGRLRHHSAGDGRADGGRPPAPAAKDNGPFDRPVDRLLLPGDPRGGGELATGGAPGLRPARSRSSRSRV